MASTNGASTAQIIKSDSQGRNRYSAEYKEKVLDAYEQSGMSGVQFARKCGVKYPTFASWMKKREKARQEGAQAGGEAKDSPAFLLAEIRDDDPVAGLEVRLPGGMTVIASTPEAIGLLAQLIKALA